jgi:hypothetical protein
LRAVSCGMAESAFLSLPKFLAPVATSPPRV